MDTQIPRRRSHRGTWFVVILGLLEIGAIVAFFELKGVASSACALSGALNERVAGGGAAAMPIGGGGQEPQTSAAPETQPQSVATSAAQPEARAAAGTSGETAGDASVSGDTNQIVDPTCVAKTTAGLLSAGTAPPAGPTCGPMQQPAALKEAEKEIQR